ncbi:MAG: ELWxxDGT repeat protein [Planctomycetota bacterium]
MQMRCPLSVSLFGAALSFSLVAQTPVTPTLLVDINQQAAATINSSNPGALGATGGSAFFAAQTTLTGREVWATDGTSAGTLRLADLVSGSGWANPYAAASVPGAVLIAASSDQWGAELFAGRPGASQLELVKDIYPGPGGMFAGSSSPILLTSWRDEVWFYANDGVVGIELWRSDGTAAGTVLADDVNPGPAGISNGTTTMAVAGEQLFFTTSYPSTALWVKPNPTATPVMLMTLPSSPFGAGTRMNAAGNTLVFTVDTAAEGEELWRSDGTVAGTFLLADIYPGPTDSRPSAIAEANGRLWFGANHPSTGRELYVTDGTVAGTTLVRDIRSGTADGVSYTAGEPLGSGIVFAANDGIAGEELWFSDGTTAGTRLVADIHPGASSSLPWEIFTSNGRVWLRADDGVRGAELWVTDGTAAGTLPVLDINPGPGNSSLLFIAELPSGMVLSANGGGRLGQELWFSDGTQAGTTLLGNLDPEPTNLGSGVTQITKMRDLAVFRADNGTSGLELWATDGTAAGTQMLVDIAPGSGRSVSTPALEIDAGLLFTASPDLSTRELWITDGTPAGTQRLFSAAASLSVAQHFRGATYFWANDGSGAALFATDGTPAGTAAVLGWPVVPGGSGDPSQIGGEWIFGADDGVSGSELWKSDGTPAGTTLIADLRPGPGSSGPAQFVQLPNRLVFTAFDGTERQFWGTDGTAAGTEVLDASLSTLWGLGFRHAVLGDELVFAATDGVLGRELWISNGTAAGTRLLMDLLPGAGESNPFHFATVDDHVYFWAADAAGQTSLWKTDGTPAGTVVVRRWLSPLPQFVATPLMPIGGGQFVFRANDGVNGTELWISNGTLAGTRILADSAPGMRASWPLGFSFDFVVRVGSQLLFAADDNDTGSELHAVPLDAVGAWAAESIGFGCGATTLDATGAVTLGGAFSLDLTTAQPSTPVGLLASAQLAWTPLGGNCLLHVAAPVAIGAVSTSAGGAAAIPVGVPNDPALLGAVAYFQALAAINGGPWLGRFELSPGLEIVVGS